MTLYEVLNGYIGESYVRCYVWAETPDRALELANEQHRKKYKVDLPERCIVNSLFSSESAEFATEFDDAGWSND
jgi:hypothetical protein